MKILINLFTYNSIINFRNFRRLWGMIVTIKEILHNNKIKKKLKDLHQNNDTIISDSPIEYLRNNKLHQNHYLSV